MVYKKHNIGTNIQALALAEAGTPVQLVSQTTGLAPRTIYHLRVKARARGFDPQVSPMLKLEYVEDGDKSGRPKKISEEREDNDQQCLRELVP